MKKLTLPAAKLKLNRDTLKTLNSAALANVAGGAATDVCTKPTSTVQHTFDC